MGCLPLAASPPSQSDLNGRGAYRHISRLRDPAFWPKGHLRLRLLSLDFKFKEQDKLEPGIDKRINYHAFDTMKRKIRYNFLTIRRAQYEEQGLDETQVDSVV
jgi:hypothetical protein